jgi:hypothetical protein
LSAFLFPFGAPGDGPPWSFDQHSPAIYRVTTMGRNAWRLRRNRYRT